MYIFTLKTLGFWRRQFIESVYIFPETLWILETPIHRKPLFVYILSLRPFGFWRRQFIESPCHQGDQRSNFGPNDSREPKTQGLKSFKDRGLPPTISASVIQRDQRSNFGLNDSRASEFQGIEGKGTKDAKIQSLRG